MSSKPAKASKPTANVPGISDRATLRERARRNLEDGAITDSYSADREVVIKLLNDALATEYVCVLRYYRHYFMAKGMLADAVKAEFLEHAQQEQAHAGKLAERIVQLGGEQAVDWLLDGRWIAQTRGAQLMQREFAEPGAHTLTALAADGAWTQVRFNVLR